MNTPQPHLNSLPDSDIELLSAYMDLQLDPTARAELEQRLDLEPRLRAELEELRATAAMLRDLAPLRPPRSFTLDPAVAPRRRGVLPLAWVMQLGGGLAGLALVLLASLQMLGGVSGNMAAAPAPMLAVSTAEPPAAAAPMGAVFAPTGTPAVEMAVAATESPLAAAREAPAATAAAMALPDAPTANGESAQQPIITADSTAGGLGGGAPYASASASDSSSPDSANLELPTAAPAPKAAPQPTGLSPSILLTIGIFFLALAIGSFIYSRR